MSWAVVFASLFAKGTKIQEKLFFPAISPTFFATPLAPSLKG